MAIVDMAYNRETSSILIRPEDPEASVDEQSVIRGKEFLHSEEFRRLAA
jgi:hypothetical protein